MLTQERLKELLHYNQETGVFTWRGTSRRGWNGRKAGSISNHYITISIDYISHRAHRIAWLYVHGAWPNTDIDHINGDKADNCLCNLRLASNSLNMQNQRIPHVNNKTGFLGVTIEKGRFVSAIRENKKKRRLGGFDTPEEAYAVYLQAKRKTHEGCTI